MRILIILIYIIIAVSHISCNKKDNLETDFQLVEHLSTKDSINLEKLGILSPADVTYRDSIFIFSNFHNQKHISILNKSNFKLNTIVNRGEGLNEILHYMPVQSQDQKFLFLDRLKGTLFELQSSDNYNKIAQFNNSIGRFYTLSQIDSNVYIGTGMFERNRFLIYDTSNHKYKFIGDYPQNKEISSLNNYQKSALYARSFIGIQPYGNTIVVTHNGLIDFYTIDKDWNLSLKACRYYHFPEFSIPEKGPIIAHKKEGLTGVISSCYNSEYIYLLYSKTSLLEKGSDTFTSNTILVFNWDGTPIKQYVLDNDVRSICIEGNNIWAISGDFSFLCQYKIST